MLIQTIISKNKGLKKLSSHTKKERVNLLKPMAQLWHDTKYNILVLVSTATRKSPVQLLDSRAVQMPSLPTLRRASGTSN